MASIEFLTKRVEGKKAELQKLTAKMERIEKAQATNWAVNPYCYNERDLISTAKQIAQAEKALADYTAKLEAEQGKANSRNVTVIIEFLENWKQNMRDFYADEFAKYPTAKAEYKKERKEIEDRHAEARRHPNTQAWKEYRKEEKAHDKAFADRWGFLFEYVQHNYRTESYSFDSAKFEKDIKREAERKYDDIIDRTKAIVGEITDASGIEVGYKGNLDGFIIGTEGKAKFQTIGAGGYNIQCFHFRTLIHEVQ